MKLQTLLKKLGTFEISYNYQDTKNQIYVRFEKGNVFISHGKIIAVWFDHKYYLTDLWDYSFTTTRYLGRFLGGVKKSDIKKSIDEGVYIVLEEN